MGAKKKTVIHILWSMSMGFYQSCNGIMSCIHIPPFFFEQLKPSFISFTFARPKIIFEKTITMNSKTIPLSRVMLFKNELAFYEHECCAIASDMRDEQHHFNIAVPKRIKDVVVGTLTVKCTASETVCPQVNFDTERADAFIDDTNNSSNPCYNFSMNSYMDFLKSCTGSSIEVVHEQLHTNQTESQEHTDEEQGQAPSSAKITTRGIILMIQMEVELGSYNKPIMYHNTEQLQPPHTEVFKKPVIYLLEAGQVYRIPLSTIHSLKMLDTDLQQQLIIYLSRRREGRFPSPRAESSTLISIITSGSNTTSEDRITASYVSMSMPWICSYRIEAPAADTLVVGKSEVDRVHSEAQTDANALSNTSSSANKHLENMDTVTLHMMAHVQNTGDQYWDNVKVCLVTNDLELADSNNKKASKMKSSIEKLPAEKSGTYMQIFIKVSSVYYIPYWAV